MKQIYLTKEGLEKLRKEYEELKNRRPQLLKHLEEARALGDLRENAEYHSTKEAIAKLDARIFSLEQKLRSARIIEKDKMSRGEILLGSTVTIKNIDTNEEFVYQLVDPEEADVDSGKISINSPIASALIGKKKGDTVEVTVPAGKLKLKIIKIDV